MNILIRQARTYLLLMDKLDTNSIQYKHYLTQLLKIKKLLEKNRINKTITLKLKAA